MSFRRRHRRLRRLALGLALATVASLAGASAAAAERDDGRGVTVVTGRVPLLGGAPANRGAAQRPDDRAVRFAHSGVAAPAERTELTAWTFRRGDALILAVGGLVLGFGLALALGYLRRPRLAGF